MGNFPKFRPKNSGLSVLPENWHTWYNGGADYNGGAKFIFGQIWAKKVEVSVLPEKLAHRVSQDADSYSEISFLKFISLNPSFGQI